MNFGGGYFGNNLYLLEGGYDVAQGWGGIMYVPAPEDTDQVKVTSYSFSAQYGWSTGNVISLTTKAGTHDYHFVADEYIRNPKLDANLYFNNLNGVPKPNDHRNQFGFAGGGPLYIPGIYKQRDKTFFFANYEGLRLNGVRQLQRTGANHRPIGGRFLRAAHDHVIGYGLPGPDHLSGRDLQSLLVVAPARTEASVRNPYPGNIIPTSGPGAIDALAKKFATGNYWPAPKNPGGQFNFNTTASAPTTSNEWGIRIDHNINANNRIYGQFSNKHEGKVQTPAFYGDDVAGPYVFDPNNRMFGVLGYSHVFSPTLVLSSELILHSQSRREQCSGLPVQAFHARAAGPTRYVDSTVSAGSVWEHLWREFLLCSPGSNTKLRRSQLPAE